jgi:cytoskeletal protein CcmA (bactofilin family)
MRNNYGEESSSNQTGLPRDETGTIIQTGGRNMFTRKDTTRLTDIVGLLGKGTTFDGKLIFEGTVRIDGIFSGEIATKGLLVIGDEAIVRAQVKAEKIIIRGEMHGNIHATKVVEIRGTGKVCGDIRTPSLIVEEGVLFEGTCTMAGQKEKAPGNIQPKEACEEDKMATG